MTINKFQGKTEEEALEKARSEMGQGLVIMNVRVVKPKGLFGFLKTPYYEVTAAMEDKEPVSVATTSGSERRRIDLAADEQIELPGMTETASRVSRPSVPVSEPISEAARAVGDILSAHAAQQNQQTGYIEKNTENKNFKKEYLRLTDSMEELEQTLSEQQKKQFDEIVQLFYTTEEFYFAFSFSLGLKYGEELKKI